MALRITLAVLSYTIGLLILNRTFNLLVDRDFRKPLHLFFCLGAICIAVWNFCYSIVYCAPQKDLAMAAYSWSSFGWTTGFACLTVFFNILFSTIKSREINITANLAVVAIGTVFNIAALRGIILISDMRPSSWGWLEVMDSKSPWVIAYGIFIMTAIVYVFIRATIVWRGPLLNRQLRQMKMIAIPFAAFTVPTALFDYISPFMGLDDVPQIGQIILGCVVLFICQAVDKYRVLDFDPTYVGPHLLFGVSDYVFLTDTSGIVLRAGNAACEILKADHDDLTGRPLSEICPGIDMGSMLYLSGKDRTLSVSLYAYDGESIPVRCTISDVLDVHDDHLGFLLVMNDLRDIQKLEKMTTELRQTNELLKLMSITDPLTGLFNRKKINDEIEREFCRFQRNGMFFSIIMFDIDHFKSINDTLGHSAGDVILKKIASVCFSMIRRLDTLARWGGEEFMVLCVETREEAAGVLA